MRYAEFSPKVGWVSSFQPSLVMLHNVMCWSVIYQSPGVIVEWDISGSPNMCIRNLVLKKCLSKVTPGSNSSLQLKSRIISESVLLVQCQHRISSVNTALANVSTGSAVPWISSIFSYVKQGTRSSASIPIPDDVRVHPQGAWMFDSRRRWICSYERWRAGHGHIRRKGRGTPFGYSHKRHDRQINLTRATPSSNRHLASDCFSRHCLLSH